MPRDDPFLIAAGDVGQPEAVSLRNGGFAVLWSEEPTEGSSGERLLLRSFEADGSSPAPAVAITEDVGYTIDYSLIELADGGFLVNWRARGLEGYDYENYASRFAADGTPLGEIFSIPQRTVGSEREIQFSPLADDFILATWNSYDFLTLEQDGDRSVGVYSTLFGRILAPNGETVGAEFQVFQIRSGGSLSRPDFALTPDGSVIVTAHDYVSVSERYYERYENSELVTVRFDLQPGMPGMIGSVGDDRLTGGPEDEVLRGLEGDDVIDGGSGDDAVEGGPGGDTLFGGDGNDTIDGGPGTKEYRYRWTEGMFEARNKLHGGAGDDLILGGLLRDEITGGSGADRIFGYSGNDLIYGQDGNDTIAGGFGVDELIEQNGDDVINGSAYSDLIFGGDGDDYVNGGFGFDRINGGACADLFYHAGNEGHGSDWIQDYDALDGDLLVFGGSGASASDFVVRSAHTATPAGERSGDDDVQEAFVNFRGQTLWALVDGAGEAQINLQIGGETFDLLA